MTWLDFENQLFFERKEKQISSKVKPSHEVKFTNKAEFLSKEIALSLS